MNAGWFPDPWTPGLLRWWDGTIWTPHTAPAMPYGSFALWHDPRADLAREQAAARRASVAVIFVPIFTAFYAIVVTLVIGSVWSNAASTTALRPATDQGVGWLFLADVGGLMLLGVQILFIVWLYQAATLARRTGLPSRRDPVWAILGFIIPVVSFWFPYQVAAGCFRPDDPNRRLAGHWWGWYLAQAFAVAPVVVSAFFSAVVAVCFGAVAVAVAVIFVVRARQLIAAVVAGHEKLLLSPGSSG